MSNEYLFLWVKNNIEIIQWLMELYFLTTISVLLKGKFSQNDKFCHLFTLYTLKNKGA